jgi:hypothetical protein
MKKVGRMIEPIHQLCFAHGIHLAVTDVLYQKLNFEALIGAGYDEHSNFDGGEDIDDAVDIDDSDLEGFEILSSTPSEDELLIKDAKIKALINKFKTVVKLFHRTPTKNDEVLQKHVIDDFKKELT